MTWIYILAAIVAQGIVVVLLIEYIYRKPSKSDSPVAQTTETPETGEQKEPDEKYCETDVVGESTFSYEEFKAMQEDIKALRECVESMMDAKDADFDVKQEPEAAAPDARMSPEAEAKAWEDHRDEIAQLDNEDETVAYPNPLATGADFDSIAKATVILETPDGRTHEDLQFAVNLYKGLDGTEFRGCLPNALLEKLYECHRKVELNDNAFPEDKTEEKKAQAEKENPQPKKERAPKRKTEQPVKQPTESTPKQKFSMAFVRNSTKKQ